MNNKLHKQASRVAYGKAVVHIVSLVIVVICNKKNNETINIWRYDDQILRSTAFLGFPFAWAMADL